MSPSPARPNLRGARVRVLLVEDNPGDAMLMREAFDETGSPIDLVVVGDGEQAMDTLIRARDGDPTQIPDLVVLDLNLPRKNGREVLAELKRDPALRAIPVLVLSMSRADADVNECYALQAASYIAKPVEYGDFVHVVRSLSTYWTGIATLPGPPG